MNENDKLVLAGFDAVWARVMGADADAGTRAQSAPCASGAPQMLRAMIEQTAAGAQTLAALSMRVCRHSARLQCLARERRTMQRQLQGAYYLLTGERCNPGASCAVARRPLACLRCVWLSSRTQAAQARQLADETQEALLQPLYADLAALLLLQAEALQEIVTDALA